MDWKALILSLLVVTFLTPASVVAQEAPAPGTARIGVFDSRGVAVAWGRSDAFRSRLSELTRQHTKAKEAGKTAEADSLEAIAVAWQDMLHRQVFSTAPIPQIMDELKAVLPGIAAEAGVDIIVNRWDMAYQKDNLETVDLTQKLAGHFNPTEETVTMINRLKNTPPVPLDDFQHEH